ncbi:hypothetical protein, partial [Allofournierella sp. CML151]|uniref:hypothetical protein n=1 Tax=Allofournierella sp. CML151 TaxID=2998082 RepID=UPI0022EAA300
KCKRPCALIAARTRGMQQSKSEHTIKTARCAAGKSPWCSAQQFPGSEWSLVRFVLAFVFRVSSNRYALSFCKGATTVMDAKAALAANIVTLRQVCDKVKG